MPAEYTAFHGLYEEFIFWSIIVGVIVFLWLLYAVLRFRIGMVDESNLEKLEPGVFPKERDNMKLEAAWVVLPTILVAWLCILSWQSLYDAWGTAPDDEDAFVVEVTATQWNWAFTYTEPILVEETAADFSHDIDVAISDGSIIVTTEFAENLTASWTNGPASGKFNITDGEGSQNTVIDLQETLILKIKDADGNEVHSSQRYPAQSSSAGEVYVPCGEEIKMKMTSERLGDADAVLHSLFLPEWGVKEDVVPGVSTMLYFTPQETGTFDVICAEYCGMRHAYMKMQITVIPVAESVYDGCRGDA